MKDLEIPAELSRHLLAEHGAEAQAWMDQLPSIVAMLAERWSLELDRPLSGPATASWVAPAGQVDGVPVVLKVSWPHHEAETEADGLRFFGGRGAVRVVRADQHALAVLLERCLPGDDLWSLPVDEGNEVAAEVLQTLWRPAPAAGPIESLADVVGGWIETFAAARPDYPEGMRTLAVELARELVRTQAEPVVLHGDFNPGNVLSSRRGWLCIDCKPLVGDPAYDLAQFLANRIENLKGVDAVGEIGRQVDFFAGRLGLERDRMAGWAFVKALGWEWGADTAELFARVAGRA